jgi:hypothetical protein
MSFSAFRGRRNAAIECLECLECLDCAQSAWKCLGFNFLRTSPLSSGIPGILVPFNHSRMKNLNFDNTTATPEQIGYLLEAYRNSDESFPGPKRPGGRFMQWCLQQLAEADLGTFELLETGKKTPVKNIRKSTREESAAEALEQLRKRHAVEAAPPPKKPQESSSFVLMTSERPGAGAAAAPPPQEAPMQQVQMLFERSEQQRLDKQKLELEQIKLLSSFTTDSATSLLATGVLSQRLGVVQRPQDIMASDAWLRRAVHENACPCLTSNSSISSSFSLCTGGSQGIRSCTPGSSSHAAAAESPGPDDALCSRR